MALRGLKIQFMLTRFTNKLVPYGEEELIQWEQADKVAEMTHKANHSEAGETRHFDAQVGITNEDFLSQSRAIALVDLFKSHAHTWLLILAATTQVGLRDREQRIQVYSEAPVFRAAIAR